MLRHNRLSPKTLFSVLAFMLLGACTQSRDGAMDLNPDGNVQQGTGFYLVAELNDSHRIHLSQDTLRIRLDSIWAISHCFLDSLVLHDSLVNDTTLFLRYEVRLLSDGDPSCPSRMFLPDTLLNVPMRANWNAVRQIIITGTPRSDIIQDTTRQDSAWFHDSHLDSIRVRRGTLASDTFFFYFDSLYFDPALWPRKTPGDTAVLMRLDSLKARSYAWRPVQATCNDIRDNCPTRPDTLWPTSWLGSVTTFVTIRPVCSDSTRTYCSATAYQTDTTNAGDIQSHPDTTFYSSLYYIEKNGTCAGLGYWGPIQGTLQAGYSASLIREAFNPAADEPDCSSNAVPGWLILNLSTNQEVTSSAIAQEILDAANHATIADTLR